MAHPRSEDAKKKKRAWHANDSNFISKAKLVLKRLLPSCKVMTYLISTSLETELALHLRFLPRLHILVCVACARYRQQLLFIGEVARGAPKLPRHHSGVPDRSLPEPNQARLSVAPNHPSNNGRKPTGHQTIGG